MKRQPSKSILPEIQMRWRGAVNFSLLCWEIVVFSSEDAGGGGRRGWKASRMTPLPERGFGPPIVRYVFHPSGVSALFFLYQNPRQSRPEAFLEGSKTSGECVLWYIFLPPYVLDPPCHGPISWIKVINWGLYIKFKGLLCGNPTERGKV